MGNGCNAGKNRNGIPDLSPSLEDYLEEVYRFSQSQPTIRVSDISHKLNVALPSVTKALHKLKEKDYITYQRYGMIGLTAKGEQAGKFLVDRNRVLQDFLLILNAECNVAAEAEAMEHYLSTSTINAIQSFVLFMKDNTSICKQLTQFIEQHREICD